MTVTTEWLDEETGEIIKDARELKDDSIKKPRATSKKSKVDDRPEPILTLEDNKYILSQGAVDALEVEPGDKLDIKFQKIGNALVPVIGKNSSFGTQGGNKVTQTFTVSCRGKANNELASFGNEFMLEKHPSAEGLFILTTDGEVPDIPVIEKPEPEDDTDDKDIAKVSDDDLDFVL